MEIFMFMLGITVVIGGIILIFSDTDGSSGTDGVVITLFGLLFITSAIFIKEINANEISTEVETVTESQSIKSSSIKVVILNKYSGAEIISDGESGKGYFIYEQEKYSYELDDNILFINRDNKTVDYLYVN